MDKNLSHEDYYSNIGNIEIYVKSKVKKLILSDRVLEWIKRHDVHSR